MTSHTRKEQDIQRQTPPTPEALARWLLAAEVGENTSPEVLAAAGEHVYHRLREHLAVLLGATGFDALWARAMHLAQPTFRAGDDTAAEESFPTHTSRTDGVHAAVRGRDSSAVKHNLVVVFTSFITLLCTFIGAELSLRFIRKLWPDLPPDAATLHAEEATR